MGDGHGGVRLKQEHRHRLADERTATDDDSAGAGNRDPVLVQQVHDAERRGRDQGLPPEVQLSGVEGM